MHKSWPLLILITTVISTGCTGQPTLTAPPPSPTHLPTSTPTAGVIPDALRFQNTHSWLDSDGTYHIMGEVINQGPYPLQKVVVAGWLSDSLGQTIAEAHDELDLHVIMPGQTAPFDIDLLSDTTNTAYNYRLWAAGEGIDLAKSSITHQIALLGVLNFPPGGTLRFDGMVTNTGKHTLARATVAIALVNVQNQIIGVGTVVVPGPLAAGEVATFSQTFLPGEIAGGEIEAATGYRLSGEGWRTSTPPHVSTQ